MNLLNIGKNFLYLVETEYTSGNSATTTDEVLCAERLFEMLKSFKDNYFNEIYTYHTLEFEDELDEIADEEENDNELDELQWERTFLYKKSFYIRRNGKYNRMGSLTSKC